MADLEDYLTARRTPAQTATKAALTRTRPAKIDWPHAPPHRITAEGTYFVTGATYDKAHHFRGPERLDLLHDALHEGLYNGGWVLEAWAVFSNHYHVVAHEGPKVVTRLSDVLKEVHWNTGPEVNILDGAGRRKVWHNFYDKTLSFDASYHARLAYTNFNAVKHGLVTVATQYPWCSAAWYERVASPAWVNTLARLKTDDIVVVDDFDVVM